MKDNHTISLLKECDSVIKMGISSIEDVMKYVESNELKRILYECKVKNQQLEHDLEKMKMQAPTEKNDIEMVVCIENE